MAGKKQRLSSDIIDSVYVSNQEYQFVDRGFLIVRKSRAFKLFKYSYETVLFSDNHVRKSKNWHGDFTYRRGKRK